MSWVLRLRYALATRGPAIAVGLVVLGAVTLPVAGWAYANPPTTEVTSHTHRQAFQTELATDAVATGNTTLYENGTRLLDQPVYLFDSSSEVRLTHATTVPSNQSVHVEQRLTLVFRASHAGETFWNATRVLTRRETTTRSGSVTTRVRLNASDLADRVAEIRSDVGGAGTLSVSIRVHSVYETDRYAGTLTATTPVRLNRDWFAIPSRSVDRRHSVPVTRTIATPRSTPGVPAGLGALAAVALAASVGTAAAYYRDCRDVRLADLERQIHESRYAEWISTGRLPDGIDEQAVIVDSLEDLVDVGIDTGNRVIYDPDREVYAVLDGPTVYYYDEFWT